MQFLHSYWRMEYLETPKHSNESLNTLFTRIPESTDDKAVYLLFRGKHTYIVLNRFPYNAGHLLVVPYREVAELSDLSAEERMDFMDTIIKSQDILKKALKPEGFNVGFNLGTAAGAGIPKHLHCHVVPRWNGDTNFMPVIANTKVLPQALDTIWERLRKFI